MANQVMVEAVGEGRWRLSYPELTRPDGSTRPARRMEVCEAPESGDQARELGGYAILVGADEEDPQRGLLATDPLWWLSGPGAKLGEIAMSALVPVCRAKGFTRPPHAWMRAA